MKPRGNQVALKPLPSPEEPTDVLRDELIWEVKNGCHPDKLFRRLRLRNQLREPRWQEIRIQNFMEQSVWNTEFRGYLHDLWNDSRPKKREMTEIQSLRAETERDAARRERGRIMSALNCDPRHAWYVQKNGTPHLHEAELLAKNIEGSAVDDWIVTISPRGKKPSPIALAITSRNMLGCSVYDYVLARPSRRLKRNDTAEWLKHAYQTNQLKRRHFTSYSEFEQVISTYASDAEVFWGDYKLWRFEKIVHELDADLLNPFP